MKRAATVDPFGQLPTNRRDTSLPRVELPGTLARVEAAGRGRGRSSWALVDAVPCSSLSFVECDIEGKMCCCDCYAKYPTEEEGREVLIACTPAMVHIDLENKILRFQAYGIGDGDYAFVDFALVVADITSSVNLLASQTGWSWATTQDKERVLICYSAPDGVTPDAT